MNVVLWYKCTVHVNMNTFRDDDVSSFSHNTNKKRIKKRKKKKEQKTKK